MSFHRLVVFPGSIKVKFNITGVDAEVTSALYKLWEQLEGGFTLQFEGHNLTARPEMLVDDEAFYGRPRVSDGEQTGY